MASQVPPKKGAAYITYVSLTSQADPNLFQVNPTLAAGDVKVSIDGGALANLTTLPVVTPAGSVLVKIALSASEMNGDNIQVVFIDAAGSEWANLVANIQTTSQQIDDVVGTNSISEPSGVPAFPASGQEMLRRVFAALVNKVTASGTQKTFFNSSGVSQFKKTTSDDGSTYTENKGSTP